MILQALTRYYEDLLQRGEIAAPGWSPAKISFALCLDKDGQVTQIINIQQPSEKGKTLIPQTIEKLPAPVKRTVGIASNFLWDNSAYLLGVDQKGEPERSRDCFRAAASLHHAVLDGVDSPIASCVPPHGAARMPVTPPSFHRRLGLSVCKYLSVYCPHSDRRSGSHSAAGSAPS